MHKKSAQFCTKAKKGAHGIACREVAQRSMQYDRHVGRSNVECPSGPTADAVNRRNEQRQRREPGISAGMNRDRGGSASGGQFARDPTARDGLSAAGRVSVGQGTRRAHAWGVSVYSAMPQVAEMCGKG
jgi:hypothetical protein